MVVGVDFGTLSGRAVVVRVSDGAELGSAVHAYAHGVMDRTLAATGAALPPDWALQVPSDYLDVLRTAVPEALAASGVRPEDVIGIGTDFTACTMLPVLADGTPVVRAPGVRRPAARLREAVEAPCGPAACRPDQRARRAARRAVAGPVRRADLLGVGVRQGPAAAGGGPGDLRPDGPLGRGGGLDRLAAVRAATSATPAPPATRRSTRTGTTRRGTTWRR